MEFANSSAICFGKRSTEEQYKSHKNRIAHVYARRQQLCGINSADYCTFFITRVFIGFVRTRLNLVFKYMDSLKSSDFDLSLVAL